MVIKSSQLAYSHVDAVGTTKLLKPIRLAAAAALTCLALSPSIASAQEPAVIAGRQAIIYLQRICLPHVIVGDKISDEALTRIEQSGLTPVDNFLTRGKAFSWSVQEFEVLVDHINSEKPVCRVRLSSNPITLDGFRSVDYFRQTTQQAIQERGFTQADVITTGGIIKSTIFKGQMNGVDLQFDYVESTGESSSLSIYVRRQAE